MAPKGRRSPIDDALQGVVTVLAKRHPPGEVLSRASDALDLLYDEGSADPEAPFDPATMARLLPFAKRGGRQAQAVMQALDCLVVGNGVKRKMQVIMSSDVTEALAACVRSSKDEVAKDACVALNNLVTVQGPCALVASDAPGLVEALCDRLAEEGQQCDSGSGGSIRDEIAERAAQSAHVLCTTEAREALLRRPDALAGLSSLLAVKSAAAARDAACALALLADPGALFDGKPARAPAQRREAAGALLAASPALLRNAAMRLVLAAAQVAQAAGEGAPQEGDDGPDPAADFGVTIQYLCHVLWALSTAAAAPVAGPEEAGVWREDAERVLEYVTSAVSTVRDAPPVRIVGHGAAPTDLVLQDLLRGLLSTLLVAAAEARQGAQQGGQRRQEQGQAAAPEAGPSAAAAVATAGAAAGAQPAGPACAWCRKTARRDGVQLRRCRGCLAVHYCSQECCRAHWVKGWHRRQCEPAQQRMRAELEAGTFLVRM